MLAHRTPVEIAGLVVILLLGVTVQTSTAELAPLENSVSPQSSAQAVTWVQLAPATSPPARFAAASAYDPSTSTIIIFGGSPSASSSTPIHLDDTWTWDGRNWTEQVPPVSPGPRAESHMAFDKQHQNAVLFGGCCDPTGGKFGDTWVWNGVSRTWTLVVPTGSGPPARTGAVIVYDDATQNVVLYGGCCNDVGGELADTWEWDGTAWTQLFPVVSPASRQRAAIAYSAKDDVAVLFGGYTSVGGVTLFQDTWTWNGKTWKQQFPTTPPPPLYGSTMAYHALSSTIVLFGGAAIVGNRNETWFWDNSAWTQQPPKGRPSARNRAAEVYDSATNSIVLFGGCCDSSNNAFADTWALTVKFRNAFLPFLGAGPRNGH